MFATMWKALKKVFIFAGVCVGSFVLLTLVFGLSGALESDGGLSNFLVFVMLILPPVFGFWVVKKKKSTPSEESPLEPPKVAIMEDAKSKPQAAGEVHTVTPVLDYAQRRAAVIERDIENFDQKLSAISRVPIALSSERTKRANMLHMPEIKFSNVTRSTNLQKLFPLVVLDTETTGVKPGGNDIIEVSAIKYEQDFTPVSCFTTLCKPRKPIPAEATGINGITDEMVCDAPPFALVASAFSEYIAGCNVVGHNLPFDLRFLFISGVELPPKAKYYDTLSLAKKVLTKYGSKKYNRQTGEYEESDEWDVYDYRLETLCEYYGIHRSDAHRSLSDSYVTGLLFQNLIEDKTN